LIKNDTPLLHKLVPDML